MLHNVESEWTELLREWLNITLKNNTPAQLKWIDEISQMGREKQKQFIRYFIHLLGQALRLRFIYSTGGVYNDFQISANEIDFALRLNKMCSMEAEEAIINELDKAIFYIERNAHSKMLFHALSIRVYHIIKDNSLILMN
jgi:DNA polymerase-3 subunit delta'